MRQYDSGRQVEIDLYFARYFFGNFGAHNFYIGDKESGRLHLYLFLLPVIGWLISSVMAIWEICTVSQDSSGRPFVD